MADDGGERTLIKIAIFCVGMSLLTTALLTVYVAGSSDYDYETISLYRSEITEFSGGKLVNDNPWVLKAVFTPFTPSTIDPADIPNHIDDDNGQSIGWLYGESIAYPDIDKVTGIKLDKDQKSNQLLTVGNPYSWEYQTGRSWWNGGNDWGITIWNADWVKWISDNTGIGDIDDDYGYETVTGEANNWNYTGYRYVFDPILPFKNESSTKDGRLSVVWYQIPNDTGLSGALEIYGTSPGNNQVKLGSISASEIITAFRSTAGYVQTFDFNFEGTHLNLTIQFEPIVYTSYNTLQDAWDDGAWSMAISSASAGNFFDVENSNAFESTAGSMFDTFISIYTFDYPHFNENAWAEFILWMLVGFPMTLAMLFISMRLVGGVFKIF